MSEGGGGKAVVKGYRFAGKTGTAEKLKASGGYETNRYIASFAGFGPIEDVQVVALVVIDDPVGAYYGGEIAAPVFGEIMTQVMRYLNIRPQVAQEWLPVSGDKPKAQLVSKQATDSVPKQAPAGKTIVPNVRGKSIREAADMLTKAGLALVPEGTGRAVSQQAEANSIVDTGIEIKVIFEQ